MWLDEYFQGTSYQSQNMHFSCLKKLYTHGIYTERRHANGNPCTSVFSCHCKRTEHCPCCSIPAPFPADTFHPDKKHGRRTWIKAADPRHKRFQKSHPDRRRHDSAKTCQNSAEIVCGGLALGGSANLPDTYCMLKQK